MIWIKFLLFSIMLCCAIASIGQIDLNGSFDFLGHPSSYIHLNQFKENNETGYFVFRQRYSEVVGSPYWYKEKGAIATLMLNDGSLIEEVPIQYDVYTDEIIATQKDQGEFIIDSKFFQEISIDHGESTTRFKKVHADNPNKFYKILAISDKAILYKDIDISYNIQEIRVTGLTSDIKRFNRRHIYFFSYNDNVKKINLKKKDIINLFPSSRKSATKQFIKQRGLKYRSEEDVIEMIIFAFSDQ